MTLTPADFFVLRTPRLSYDEAPDRIDGLSVREMPARGTLSAGLSRLLSRNEIIEALYVASPALIDRLKSFDKMVEKDRRRLEESLLKYLFRMSSRCTPFGLFAELAVGTVSDSTSIVLGDEGNRRRTSRLDMDYLSGITDHAVANPRIAAALCFRANETWYEIAGTIRFVDYASRVGAGRSYQLALLEADEPLRAVLAAAATESPFMRLVDVARHWADSEAEAQEYIHGLVATRILLPSLEAPIVGSAAPAEAVAEQLSSIDAGRDLGTRLKQMNDALAAIDAEPIGGPLGKYDALTRIADDMPIRAVPGQLFQVDCFRDEPAIAISRHVASDAARAAEILYQLMWYNGANEYREPELARFRKSFVEQYEQQEIPLLNALDAESGVGYDGAFGDESDYAPLISRFRDHREAPVQVDWGPRESYLLELTDAAVRRGDIEIVLTDRDVERLTNPGAPPPPRVACARIQLETGVRESEHRFKMSMLTVASSIPLFGRFCFGHSRLWEHVGRQWALEAAEYPDAVVAEIVHLPQNRHGNIILRPSFGNAEIMLLGRSASPNTTKIPLRDLTVRVEGDRIIVRSLSLQKDIIPKLTSAHSAFATINVPAYRFLYTLASQERPVGVRWNWRGLKNLSFRPRVRVGNAVLSSAEWVVTESEMATVCDATGTARMEAVQRLRTERRIPRYVYLQDEEPFFVDLESCISVDTLVSLAGRARIELVECFGNPETSVVTDREGRRYAHEIYVPFVCSQPRAEASTVPPVRRSGAKLGPPRARLPGAETTYAKIYCGTATADGLIANAFSQFAQSRVAAGQVRRWFFIRYRDPDPHIRLRFFCDSPEMGARVRFDLARMTEGFYRESRIRRLVFDSYIPEVERYGGLDAMEDAEGIFHADSVCAAALVKASLSSSGMRWIMASFSMLTLARTLGLDNTGVLADLFTRSSRRLFRGSSRQIAKQNKKFLATSYREHRRLLRGVVEGDETCHPLLAMAKAPIAVRSLAIFDFAENLQRRDRDGGLTLPIDAIVMSHVHMCSNRLFRSEAVTQELVLYDHLGQALRGAARVSSEPRDVPDWAGV